MRVLLGHCFYRSSAPSGEDSVYKNEKELLLDNGVEVVTYEKQNDDLKDHGFYRKTLDGLNYIWSKRAYHEVSEIIKSTRPDIAHFHNIFPQMSTSVHQACKEHGVPVVQTLHNFRNICPAGLLQRHGKPCELCIDGSILNSIQNKCYRNSYMATLPMASMIAYNRTTERFYKNVDQYIALTEFAKSRFIRAGFPADLITVKPNFVAGDSPPKNVIGDYILYVGRLTQEKGIVSLVEAAKHLKHIPLKIVGDGELRELLASTVIKFDLNVEFLGRKGKTEVLDLMDNSRFVVIPSECYEGFPVTICEAFSRKKPVAGSKIGSLDEIIKEGVTGRKFSAADTTDIARVIADLWSDVESVQKYSESCYQEYKELFGAKSNFNSLECIYRQQFRTR